MRESWRPPCCKGKQSLIRCVSVRRTGSWNKSGAFQHMKHSGRRSKTSEIKERERVGLLTSKDRLKTTLRWTPAFVFK